jgi:transcriptional regulator of acetoin/glycerol metabolism
VASPAFTPAPAAPAPLQDMVAVLAGGHAAPAAPAAPRWSGETAAPSKSLEEMEIDAIRRAVDEAGGNISEASKRLGISRNTIYRKLRWNAPR